jgi:hypothetical protein
METLKVESGVGRRVAVTTTGFRVTVSDCWEQTRAKGVERRIVEKRNVEKRDVERNDVIGRMKTPIRLGDATE